MWALFAAFAWAAPVTAEYDEGLTLRTTDGNWQAKVEVRGQFRATYASLPKEGETSERVLSFQIQRARLRLGGHAYRPWLRYYAELDLVTPRILDLRMTVGPKWGHVQVGQWKAELGRERRASSRELQLVDRSIVNEWFTIDRQVGVSMLGHLFEGTPGDLHYALGAFAGHGARTVAADPTPMVAGRL